jgi:predicted nucleotidyltransferase
MSILTKEDILSQLKKLQPEFEKDNLKLLGLFGSYARDEAKEDSDIDILIETTPEFLKRYRGWDAFSRLEEYRELLKNKFKKDIDIVDKQGLLQHNNTYILKKAIYV